MNIFKITIAIVGIIELMSCGRMAFGDASESKEWPTIIFMILAGIAAV